MKQLISLLIAAVFCSSLHAAEPLRFNADGTFKIVQLTDIHHKWGKKASEVSIELIEEVLDAEKPDFVIVTGDMVYADGALNSIDTIFQPIVRRGIPFAFTFGNHDMQFDASLGEIYDRLQTKPRCVAPPRGDTESPDYVVEIISSKSDSVASVFYCIDSHGGNYLKGTGKYAWIEAEQIMWHRQLARDYMADNGGRPVPSLMFFHIPLPEVAQMAEKGKITGTKKEKVCSPDMNSGLFISARETGDVYAMFFGHDHDNDFVGDWYGILLGYGRYSGGNTVYNHLRYGARVITLHEGTRSLDTHIYLRGGEIIESVSYPDDFGKKK